MLLYASIFNSRSHIVTRDYYQLNLLILSHVKLGVSANILTGNVRATGIYIIYTVCIPSDYCMHLHSSVHVHVCTCTCICVYALCVYMHACMYIHIQCTYIIYMYMYLKCVYKPGSKRFLCSGTLTAVTV